ncbi:MAG TPA: hypothetical protein ENG73_07395 [Desulfobacterales bacterium]|nr:hypothetical protein [Desulfobacterales bacterium]
MSRYEKLNVNELRAKKIILDRGDNLSKTMVLEALKATINYNVADPYTVSMGILPAGAELVATIVDVQTAFNAGTTNVLVVGTSGDDDAYVAAGDVDETSAGVTIVSGKGKSVSADTEVFVKYTQTGTAATAGKAVVTMLYVRPRS